MGTRFPEIFAALAAPFEREEVKSRTAHGGRVLHYVTARSVMNRLDEVLGPENWWDNYEFFGQTGCKCHLSLRLPEGLVVVKVGVGGVTPMPDESDTDKTGESDSFKRAAMKFGVGRYLYGDGVPRYTAVRDQDSRPQEETPRVDGPAPSSEPAPESAPVAATEDAAQAPPSGPRPRTGKALFGWVRDQERNAGLRLMPGLVEWGRANGLPDRMLDWDADQVRLAWREIRQRIDGEPAPKRSRPSTAPSVERN